MTSKDPQYDRLNEMIAQVKAPEPLPEPEGKVVKVSSAWDIVRAIEDAEEHSTIVIAKGRYVMPRDIILDTHYVTIRGETGNREDVILDAEMEFHDQCKKFGTRLLSDKMHAPAILKLTRCRHVTVADLTFANSPKYGLMFIGDSRVHHLTMHNVKFHNCWARGFKGTGTSRIDHMPYTEEELGYNPAADEHVQWNRPRHGIVRHCLFINDRIKQNVEDGFNGDYTAGMDIMGIQDFHVHDNVFVGIRGHNGGGRGSVFIWIGAEDLLVENNVFVGCDKAISFGNPSGPAVDVTRGEIRGNTIIGGCNKAIEVQHGGEVTVHDNRICSDERRGHHAIQVLESHGPVKIYDNLIQADPTDPFKVDEFAEVGENNVGDFNSSFADIDIGDLSIS